MGNNRTCATHFLVVRFHVSNWISYRSAADIGAAEQRTNVAM
jgi:hypothetical protein